MCLIPFSGEMLAQGGTVMNKAEQTISPKEIITMDWLAENVTGSVPAMAELTEDAQELVKLQGINIKEKTEAPTENHEDPGNSR